MAQPANRPIIQRFLPGMLQRNDSLLVQQTDFELGMGKEVFTLIHDLGNDRAKCGTRASANVALEDGPYATNRPATILMCPMRPQKMGGQHSSKD
jgi:hypothetical protein